MHNQAKEYVKKLTGKNPKDFEFAAAHIVNNADVEVFCVLVEQSDFLFDFIKENVKKRLSAVISHTNYKNLLKFLKKHSQDYEELIISSLAKFADEDLTDTMLELLEHGSNDEKAYAAKYFSRINDTLAIDILRQHSYSDFDALALNCAEALSAMEDRFSYDLAVEKLNSDDEFEKVSAVRFLVAYKDKNVIDLLFDTMKKSSMPENIASEIAYLKSFLELIETHEENSLLAICHILNGLGEITPLCQLFDFQLFEVLEKLIQIQEVKKSSKVSLVLLNAKLKFEQLTENEEYIFDEDKSIKEEVFAIKELLNSQTEDFWGAQKSLFQTELIANSDFVFFALEVIQEIGQELGQELKLDEAFEQLKALLQNNQTLTLKTLEVIKSLNKLSDIDKNEVLEKITDENIKAIINSLF